MRADTLSLVTQPRRAIRKTAFTLLEVLVVVSIVALLLAVVLPALRGAKSRARRLQCAVGMRQIGVGLATYAAEANDTLPLNAGETWKTAGAVTTGMQIVSGIRDTWIEELQRAMGRAQSPWLSPLRCPQSDYCTTRLDCIVDVNERPGSGWILNAYCRGRKQTAIPVPSDGVLIMENGCWTYMAEDTGYLEFPHQPEYYPHPDAYEEAASGRWAWPYAGHERNILWCDGHVSTHPAAQWPDGDGMFDDARRRHMRFNLPGAHPLDP